MNKVLLLLLSLALTFIGCSYENKNRYELTVNEKVEIYYTTNSCCYYCVSNAGKLKHVKLIERKKVDSGLTGFDGSNHTSAFVFEATSVGIDTIRLAGFSEPGNCDTIADVGSGFEKYIVEVK